MDDEPITINRVWDDWAEGKSRCPYCIDTTTTYHTVCDCPHHDLYCGRFGCVGK